MKKRILLPVFVLIFSAGLTAQAGHQVVLNVSVADSLQEKFQSDGRLYIFISENPYGEPRFQLWPVSPMKNYIFARNYGDWKAGGILKIDAEIIFEPMQGHCSKFSHREILKMIADKLKNESE